MRYLRPLRSGDRFRGTCRVVKATAARLVFEQQLWLLPRRTPASASNGSGSAGGSSQGGAGQEPGGEQEQLVLSAEAVVVSLDSSYKPKRINAALRDLLLAGRRPEGVEAGGLSLQELL